MSDVSGPADEERLRVFLVAELARCSLTRRAPAERAGGGPIGADNATVEGVEPAATVPTGPGRARPPPALSTTFVSAAAEAAGIGRRLGSRRRFVAVRGTRQVSRETLVANTALAPVEVDLSDGTVRLGGRVLAAEPVPEVPLSRRCLLG